MVLDMKDKLFEDDAEGIPIESRASLTQDSGVMTIIAHAHNYTTYWSCSGLNFGSDVPGVVDISFIGYNIRAENNDVPVLAPVFLPDNAVVTAAIVYGSSSTETWYLRRHTLIGGDLANMASATVNSEDTSIGGAAIDNTLYSYGFDVQDLQTNDYIYGARITYTTGGITPNLLAQLTVSGKAHSGIGDKPRGYKTFFVLNNHSGSEQTIDFNIQNLTKGTTLYTKTGAVIANNTALTGTNIWSSNQISAGDEIQFEMTSGYIGTAGNSSAFGFIDWRVESIEETREAT